LLQTYIPHSFLFMYLQKKSLTMKYFITFLLAALSLNVVGQINPNYNPDYDADGFISVNDVLGVLSTFGDTWDSGDVIVGCTYPAAVEYNSSANVDDGSCTFPVDCSGVINGTSVVDECGVCGGAGSVYECGCNDIAEGACDCAGNQLDALGICGGECSYDLDGDMICDDIDDCVGSYDDCGLCNGPGAIFSCGCSTIPVGACDCDGNQLDALGICGGECSYDLDGDMICDDVDDCVGSYDDCGICNGPGSIFSCGCSTIPVGDCDCDGNQLDECGVCGGSGIAEGDCDCEGNVLDECGVCGGDNSSCADCAGVANGTSVVDECGVCGGDNSTCSDECGVPYGDNSTCFTNCGDDIAHDGYDYSTVQIGEQCWFAENCRYLPMVVPSIDGNESYPYYYVYGYQGTDLVEAKATENYETYGVLYNWPAVMTEAICPSGWHIPSDGEFTELTDFLGGGSVAGYAMRSTSGWNDNGNGSNSSGFNGHPGGYRYSGGFSNDGYGGYWWSASESGSYSWRRGLSSGGDNVSRLYNPRDIGFSARCVRD